MTEQRKHPLFLFVQEHLATVAVSLVVGGCLILLNDHFASVAQDARVSALESTVATNIPNTYQRSDVALSQYVSIQQQLQSLSSKVDANTVETNSKIDLVLQVLKK